MTEITDTPTTTDEDPPEEPEVMVYDEDGNPEVLQVEEPSGQYRMHFVGLDEDG